ncbi:MAG: GTP 3',8-cyclase MoaA [Neisseria sp.]|nr:GTP 3',8-cyclase MoaA [Neisseria sp.]
MMLHDAFARRLSYLRLSITDLCNFRCVYCLPDGYQGKCKNNELSLAEIATLVQAFADCGTRKIRLTGGEPTLRSDVAEIVALCAAQKGIETVALTTNAHRLQDIFPKLRAAGLSKINISIDSFDDATFHRITGKHHPERIVADIDRILGEGFHAVKVNTLLLRTTAWETLHDALDFVRRRPVTLRFIELMQTGDNHALFASEHIRATELETALTEQGWQLRPRDEHAGPAREYSHPDYTGGIGIIAPYADSFCTTCNRLRVSAQGKLHLCLFAAEDADIRPFLTRGDAAGLSAFLREIVLRKPENHFLHQKRSGLIRDLSMIGG